jgi:hypothetical protein
VFAKPGRPRQALMPGGWDRRNPGKPQIQRPGSRGQEGVCIGEGGEGSGVTPVSPACCHKGGQLGGHPPQHTAPSGHALLSGLLCTHHMAASFCNRVTLPLSLTGSSASQHPQHDSLSCVCDQQIGHLDTWMVIEPAFTRSFPRYLLCATEIQN